MPEKTAGSCTPELANLVHDTRWADVPPDMRHELKRCLLNYFAVALAGCTDPATRIAARTFGRFSAGRTARLIGSGDRTDALNAAALNALAANVYDYDDTHIPTIIHPTAPVAAALLAHADATPLSGQRFMLALLLGIEVQCRIGMAVSPFHYAHGWHITSTCGVFGSAMAVGKALELSPQQLAWAVGAAACQAGGLVEGLGTMAKSLSVGNAARNGMMAALLAAEGFDGPEHPLEGRYGFARVFGQDPDLDAIRDGLKGTWHLAKVAYKPYPCGIVLNPVLDASLALAGRLAPHELEHVVAIEITGHPLLRQRTDRPGVSSGRESQVSAQHAVPMALLRREAGFAAFSDTAVNDPVIRAMGKMLRFIDDEAYSVESARVRLHFNDGSAAEHTTPVARGSLQRPLNDQELEAKLRELCDYGQSGCDPEPLIEAIWNLEELEDVSTVSALAAGTGKPFW